jgi:hypothetical protein
MRTIRRLYFYAVAFVSLEVVVWGMIGLARSILASPDVVGENVDRLALPLALILAGVPFFALHWRVAERDAARDMDEHASGVRAVFLYAALLATLIPIVQNFLALLDRLLLAAFGMSPSQAMIGAGQTWADNLVAMLMNAIVAAYFITVLRADWGSVRPRTMLADIRRIYRYIWVLNTLVYVVAGVQQTLSFIFSLASAATGTFYPSPLANGLALLVLGTPLWFFAWKTVQAALAEEGEGESLLRLGALYFLALAGVVTVLSSGGLVADALLRLVFGERMTLMDLVQKVSGPLSIGIPLGGVWWYYGDWLAQTIAGSADMPRRAGMRRLYAYILSVLGLGATFVGLALLLSFVSDAAIGSLAWSEALRPRLAAALATVAAGLPLWVFFWRPMQAEALSAGDPGDHARRSIVRKVYLYLVLFASAVGGMLTAISLFNLLFRTLLGSPPSGVLRQALDLLELLFLFAGLGIYHSLALRSDGRRSASALADKHAAYAVLVFDPGDGLFAQAVQAALRKQAPRLPVTVQLAGKPVPKKAAPQAVLLPADLALDPPAVLQRWLGKFNGRRLLVPRDAERWTWTEGLRPLPAAADRAALAVRQLAEGQEVRSQTGTSGWLIFVYILAGLFGLAILMGLINLVVVMLAD